MFPFPSKTFQRSGVQVTNFITKIKMKKCYTDEDRKDNLLNRSFTFNN